MELLRGLDVLFLDALRHRPHPTHSTVERPAIGRETRAASALSSRTSATILRTRAPKTSLPPHVRLAYDGLEIE